MNHQEWTKIQLTDQFVSESCCFCDVDNDGEIELVAGDSWWKFQNGIKRFPFRDVSDKWLPDWPHEPEKDPHPHLRKGSGHAPEYKADTHDWVYDITGDGRPDILWVGMHRDPIYWCENTGRGTGDWPKYKITEGGIYESVVFTDRINGKPSLVTIPKKPYIAWYEPGDNPKDPWIENILGDEGGDWHGLGVGDIDNDGKVEVICKNFLYKQDGDIRKLWRKKQIKQILEDGSIIDGLGDIFIVDVVSIDKNSYPILISASPHKTGIWWWSVEDDQESFIIFKRHTIPCDTSQLHAIRTIIRENKAFLFFGKRWRAHGIDGDVDPYGEPKVFLAEFTQGSFSSPHAIDSSSGVGIKFDAVENQNSIMVGVSNKKGLHVFKTTTNI